MRLLRLPRLLAVAVARGLYRFTAYHPGRVPAAGPVLLAANRTTALDALLVAAAAGRAVVPAESAAQAARLLAAGAAVVVFPEGLPTRTGAMRPFGPVVADTLAAVGRPVPVVPVYLDNLWGCRTSHCDKFSPGPTPGRRRVAVYFGEPLAGTPPAAEVRAAVLEAGADCGLAESGKFLPAPRLFVRQAARYSQLFRRAYVDVATGTERSLTWGKTLVAVWSLKDWVAPRLGPSPNVVVWLPTGLGSALTNAALACLGRTPVNLNYTAGPDFVRSALAQAGADTVVTARRFLPRAPLDVPAGVTVVHLEDALAATSKIGNLVRFAAVCVVPGWALDRVAFARGRVALDAPATILFSSGSTGDPKGVVLTHRNVTANVDGFRRGIGFTQTDRMLVTMPFFHSFGHTVSLWATLAAGLPGVFYPDPRQAKEIGELCKKHRCTIMLGTATFLRFHLRRSGPDDFRSLRLLVCGAEKLPVRVSEEFFAKFGVRPVEGYGCTELSPVVSTNLPDVRCNGQSQTADTPGTVGLPIPNVCAKAFDCDTFAPLAPGEVGMLGVKGPNVMAGYLNQPRMTAEVVRGGWYMTGDVGRVEPDGFVRITGRVSRFAKIAGEMVPLERLDEELHDLYGGPADRVLAVAAVACPKRGERVVVLHLPELAGELPRLIQGLRDRGLPNLWLPDAADCYPVDSFPATPTGKLDLRRLGEAATAAACGC